MKFSIIVTKSFLNYTYRLDANGLPEYLAQLSFGEWAENNKWSISKADKTGMAKSVLPHSPKTAASSSNNANEKMKKDN
jgi:hypothetical protein